MNNITAEFDNIFLPHKALVVYESTNERQDVYVEAYDFDPAGFPKNAHPLSVDESIALARKLATSGELKSSFLQCAGLVPEKLLFVDIGLNGYAIWYTPAKKMYLHFSQDLGIKSGEAYIPSLLWKADKSSLQVFALKGTERPVENTTLFNAPFFNVSGGSVCMGTVKVAIPSDCTLEEFICTWEDYFFSSYFSHGLGNDSPAKVNLVQLWNRLIAEGCVFPDETLVKTKKTVKTLIK